MLDPLATALKKRMARGKERGYVASAEIDAPSAAGTPAEALANARWRRGPVQGADRMAVGLAATGRFH